MKTSFGSHRAGARPSPLCLDDLLAGAAGEGIRVTGIDDDAACDAAGEALAAPQDRRPGGQ
jgi:hypothetical protein